VDGGDVVPARGGGSSVPTSIVHSVASLATASAAAFQSLIGFTAPYCDSAGNLEARSAGISTPLTSGRAYFCAWRIWASSVRMYSRNSFAAFGCAAYLLMTWQYGAWVEPSLGMTTSIGTAGLFDARSSRIGRAL
jgi:hypothetical protein